MHLRWTASIGGKFAARLFARFLLAAAVPIVAVAGLASLYTNDVISERAHERLYRAASTYGHAVYDRLLIAQDQLRIIESMSIRALSLRSEAISAVAHFPHDGPRKVLLGKGSVLPQTPPRVELGTTLSVPALRIAATEDGRRVLMSARVGSGDELLVAALEGLYLFATKEQWPYATQFCVLPVDNEQPPLCPALGDEADTLAERIAEARGNDRLARIELNGETAWAVHWVLVLPSGFQASSWRIVALQPESQALAAVSAFAWIFPPAVLLALLSAGLIGVNQIRRINRPLRSLRDGVQKIAAGQFEARVRVDSADEFEELGRAFNDMAEKLGRQFHALETLSEVDRRILASDGVKAVVDALLRRVGRVIGGDLVAVVVPDSDISKRGQLYFVDHQRADDIRECAIRLDAGQLRALGGASSTQTFDLDSTESPACLGNLADAGAVSAASIPAGQADHVWGYLIIAYRQRGRTATRDIAEAQTIAARLAVAMAAARRTQQLIHQAHYDVLTQLPNRRLLMERLQTEMVRSDREGQPLALLFIDLDRFKRVNDAVGHSVGDRLLVEAAARLRGWLRQSDTAARWGGDEFVVIAAGLDDVSYAETVSRKLVDVLSRPYWIDGREYHVGASIGIAVYPSDGTTPEQLLQNADTALYQAKALGRAAAYFSSAVSTRPIDAASNWRLCCQRRSPTKNSSSSTSRRFGFPMAKCKALRRCFDGIAPTRVRSRQRNSYRCWRTAGRSTPSASGCSGEPASR